MAAAKDENRAYEVHPFRPTWRKSAERVSRLTAYATLVRARAERIAATRIALRVLFSHHRALRLQDRPGGDVLRGDQLDLVPLAAEFEQNDWGACRRVRGT